MKPDLLKTQTPRRLKNAALDDICLSNRGRFAEFATAEENKWTESGLASAVMANSGPRVNLLLSLAAALIPSLDSAMPVLLLSSPLLSSPPHYFGGPPSHRISGSWSIEREERREGKGESSDGDRFVRGNSFGEAFQTALGRCSPSSLSPSPALFARGHIQLHLILPSLPSLAARSVEPISARYQNARRQGGASARLCHYTHSRY